MEHFQTLTDIQGLIDGRISESQTLEYKRELGKTNKEIAKDMCAFANTIGGTIIYGICEKNGIPVEIHWIENKGAKERIENVVLSRIQPKVETYIITDIANPTNPYEAIFVVCVTESPDAPHMVDHRYYKRHNFQSVPMEHHEVKNAMFRKGLKQALDFEIARNFELADKTLEFLDKVFNVLPERRQRIVFIPFATEAWKSIVSSGLLSVVGEMTEKLVYSYNFIQEINCIIDCHNTGADLVTTPVNGSYPDTGRYVPSTVQNKVRDLRTLLSELKELH